MQALQEVRIESPEKITTNAFASDLIQFWEELQSMSLALSKDVLTMTLPMYNAVPETRVSSFPYKAF